MADLERLGIHLSNLKYQVITQSDVRLNAQGSPFSGAAVAQDDTITPEWRDRAPVAGRPGRDQPGVGRRRWLTGD